MCDANRTTASRGNPNLALTRLDHPVGERAAKGDDIARDKDDLVIAGVRQCECLGGERVATPCEGDVRDAYPANRTGLPGVVSTLAVPPSSRSTARPPSSAPGRSSDPQTHTTDIFDDGRHCSSLSGQGRASANALAVKALGPSLNNRECWVNCQGAGPLKQWLRFVDERIGIERQETPSRPAG